MRIVRKLLFPFALLYGFITWMRNKLYDAQVFQSATYKIPIICVGNLNAGGTGKSPMIEYILDCLYNNYKVSTLSRGYKRTSKGFKFLEISDAAKEVGDEPLQFKRKFPEALIAVDADRRNAIPKLIEKGADVILLDDAFQHRKVKAGFNILLTAYGDLYTDDFMLPTGNLRESAIGAERADVIVVTKCPVNLTEKEQDGIIYKLKPENHQELYFAYIDYSKEVKSANESISLESLRDKELTLVTGIANPAPLLEYLKKNKISFNHLKFPDHHNFSDVEYANLRGNKRILTTEKDYVRLKDELPSESLFYLPIRVGFLNKEEQFQEKIMKYIKENEV